MLKIPNIVIVVNIIIACLFSCAKDKSAPILPSDNPLEGRGSQTEKSIELGTGSGDLIIDGNDERLKDKSLILIKSGIYNAISIKNLNGNLDAPIFIKNSGQVTIRGIMYIDNVINVSIAGDHVDGMTYGINLHNISYKAIILKGELIGLTLSNLSFKDVEDYVIFIETSNDGETVETRKERIKILNCRFENTGGIQFESHLDSDEDKEFLKDFEFANNIIENSNPGNFVYLDNVQDYDIHHNSINNLNAHHNQHNGVFLLIGNGTFHHNKFTDYQGNMIRAWVFSRGNAPSTVEIFNNIAYNSRKYGAIEIQGFDRYIISGKTTFANAKVYNNTVGKMNTSKDWEGVILDLYNYGGTLEYYHNLGFDLNLSKPITDMINNMSDTEIIKNINNKYFGSASDAVFDIKSFVSKHAGIGSDL